MANKKQKRYEVIIDLMSDSMAPKIKCLAFSSDDGGYRLTDSKGCGTWNVIEKFKCSFTLQDLRQFELKKNNL